MSEVTITGIFEKVNNIFSLFKALLTPGKFQDSVLWQKEVLTILALGFCLIAAISFIAFSVINTLKKRQRNYKELVSALEEDGVELDYNLKPLEVDGSPEAPPLPASKTNQESFEDSHKDLQFENFIEELSSKLPEENDSENKIYPSTQSFTDSETSAIESSTITEKNIFALTLNHLTQSESNESSEADKVLNLSMANLKVESVDSESIENEHLVLNQNNYDEQIYNNLIDNQPIASSVIPAVKSDSEPSEENSLIKSSIQTKGISSGLGRDEEMVTEVYDFPDDSEQNNDNTNDETSIWDEVQSVISGLDDIESETETTHKHFQYENYSNIKNEISNEQHNSMDSIGLEAESVLNEFSDNKKIPLNGNNIHSESPQHEVPNPESTSTNPFITPDTTLADKSQMPTHTDQINDLNDENCVGFLPIENEDLSSKFDSDAEIRTITKIAESDSYIVDEKNIIELPCKAEQNKHEVNNNLIESASTVESLNEDSVETKQLSLFFENDSKHEKSLADEKIIPDSMHKDIKKKHSQDRLSPKTAKRIIARLEFFQKNINKKF